MHGCGLDHAATVPPRRPRLYAAGCTVTCTPRDRGGYHPASHRSSSQRRALLVLRQLVEPEAVVELAEPVLDGVDGDHQRLRDRAVARRARARAVEQRAAKLHQHAPLSRREHRRRHHRRHHRRGRRGQAVIGSQYAITNGRRRSGRCRRAGGGRRSARRTGTCRGETAHRRPPSSARPALDPRVHARDRRIPVHADVAARLAADDHRAARPSSSTITCRPSPSR